jgi:hypothetical protein
MQLPRALVRWTVLCLVIVPILYWSYTLQVWEDFLITYRHSENFVAGLGLTHQPESRVHGFTSPLNVLIPTVFAALLQAKSYTLPLLFTNAVTIACLAMGGLFLLRALHPSTAPNRRWTLWALPLFLALNIKIIAFTVNGQEAGYWVLFLGISFYALVGGLSRHWILAGIGWAGLMWTRPDSPLHIVLFAAAAVALPVESRKAEAKSVMKAVGVCTALYLPWFISTWIYYGSPIPHSIVAKSVSGYFNRPWDGLSFESASLRVLRWFGEPFLPIYSFMSGWPPILTVAAGAVGIGAAASVFSRDRITKLASIGFVGSVGYLAFVDYRSLAFPWYFIPPAVFGSVVATRWLGIVSDGVRYRDALRNLLSLTLLLTLTYSFVASVPLIEAQQRIVEFGVRQKVGIWLRNHVAPDERVFLETIGYIGYFSRARLLDYPGLVSPEVVAARKELELDFNGLIDHFRPEWLVLRPIEYYPFMDGGVSADEYKIEALFSEQEALKALDDLPGIGYLYSDAAFIILRHQKTPPAASGHPQQDEQIDEPMD